MEVAVGQQIPGFIEMMDKMTPSQRMNAFPHVMGVLNQISYMYQETWRRFASGAPIPGSPNVVNSRGPYLRSIKLDLKNDLEKRIYTDYEAHEWIEDGTDQYDLKPGLLAGPKARKGKDGPYTIVHFRHGTPGTLESNKPMPLNIFSIMQKETRKAQNAQKTTLSQVTGRTTRTPTNPGGRTHVWGARVASTNIQGQRSKLGTGYSWKSGMYAGMVRMQMSTTKAKSSQYMTFRVVSNKSDPGSWIVPARKGIPIRQAVVDTMQPILEEAIRDAFDKDLGVTK